MRRLSRAAGGGQIGRPVFLGRLTVPAAEPGETGPLRRQCDDLSAICAPAAGCDRICAAQSRLDALVVLRAAGWRRRKLHMNLAADRSRSADGHAGGAGATSPHRPRTVRTSAPLTRAVRGSSCSDRPGRVTQSAR